MCGLNVDNALLLVDDVGDVYCYVGRYGGTGELWPHVTRGSIVRALRVGLEWCMIPTIIDPLGLPNIQSKSIQHAQLMVHLDSYTSKINTTLSTGSWYTPLLRWSVCKLSRSGLLGVSMQFQVTDPMLCSNPTILVPQYAQIGL